MFLFLKKTWKIGLSILFGVAVLLFWGSVYPAHISYQEQFQLFLFDADYWWERIVVPGGLADYIAEYLTQFYYHVGGSLYSGFFVRVVATVGLETGEGAGCG